MARGRQDRATWAHKDRAIQIGLIALAITYAVEAILELLVTGQPLGPVRVWREYFATSGFTNSLVYAMPWILAFMSLLAFGIYQIRSGRAQMIAGLVEPPSVTSTVDFDSLRASAKSIQGAMHPAQGAFYVKALVQPRAVYRRISEKVVPYTRSFGVSATVTVDLPPTAAEHDVVLPLLLAGRGSIQNGLQVHNQAGTRVSTIAGLDGAAVTLAAMASVVAEAGNSAIGSYYAPRAFQYGDTTVRASLHDVMAAVVSGARNNFLPGIAQRPAKDDDFVLHVLRRAWAIPGVGRTVAQAIGALWDDYPVCVTVPAGEAVTSPLGLGARFSYHERILLVEKRQTVRHAFAELRRDWRAYAEAQGSIGESAFLSKVRARGEIFKELLYLGGRGLSNLLRHALAVRPGSIVLPLLPAARARSYHLEVAGPEDSYLMSQPIVDIKGDAAVPALVNLVPHSFSPARGQRHAHLYIRGGPTQPLQGLYYKVFFTERTPGSMASSLVIAASSLFIAIIIAKVAVHEATNGQLEGGVGLLDVLLVFPITLAAATSIRAGASPLSGDMASRFSIFATVVVSLCAVGLSAAPFVLAAKPTVANLTLAWGTVILTLALLTVAAFGSWLRRVVVHARYLSRKGG